MHEPEHILERLNRLERQNRRMKRLGVVLCLAFSVWLSMGAGDVGWGHDVVEVSEVVTEKITLIGDTPAILLRPNQGGGVLITRDSLSFMASGFRDDNLRFRLFLDKDTLPRMFLFDAEGNPRWISEVGKWSEYDRLLEGTYSRTRLLDAKKERLTICSQSCSQNDSGGFLTINNLRDPDKDVVRMGGDEHGDGLIVILDHEGNVRRLLRSEP